MDGDVFWLSDAQLGHELDEVAASGASWVRLGSVWSVVEGTQGTYSWGTSDRVVAAARARGLKVLMVLGYTPAWARAAGTDDKTPPTTPAALAAFGAFTRAAAARYGAQGVSAFEIWNEPNISAFWAPRPDAAQYTAVLRAAASGIRAAQPSATIVSGGLSPAGDAGDGSTIAPRTFIREMYADGAASSFTALGLHPYCFPALPSDVSSASWSLFQNIPNVHALMAQNGDAGKKIWFTEFGAPTGTSSGAVSPAQQAAAMTAGYAMVPQWSYSGPLFSYEVQDAGTDPSSVGENFGLRTAADVAKPAWGAYVAAMAQPAAG